MWESFSDSARDSIVAGLVVVVSIAVGATIFAYGAAVRDICIVDAGLGPAVSNAIAVVACSPILAALYSIDT